MDAIQVVMSEDVSPEAGGRAGSDESPATVFELIRYAAQALYSPRLVAPLPVCARSRRGSKGLNMNVLYDQGQTPQPAAAPPGLGGGWPVCHRVYCDQ